MPPKKPSDSDATRWRHEAERYRPAGDAIIALGSRAALDYLAALGGLRYVAQHGLHRPVSSRQFERGGKRNAWNSDEGIHVTKQTISAESKPPSYDPACMAKLRAEESWMRRRTDAINTWLDEHVGESASDPIDWDTAA